jgi:hypothetical protein
MRAEDRHLASRQFFLISTLRQRSRHFRLGQQRAPLQSRLSNRPPEIPEIPIIILRRPITFQPGVPWMRQEIAGGKGAKGGNPLEQSAVRDSSTISNTSPPLAARCRRRFGAQWLGANRRILPAQLFIGNLSTVLLSHPKGALHSKPVAEIAENAEIAGGAGRPFSHRPPLLPPSPCVC